MSNFQTFADYCEYIEALEAIDFTLDMEYGELSSPALEGEIAKVNKEYNKKLAELMTRANQAYADKDKDAAAEILSEVEKLLNEWKSKLRSLPKESSALKTVLKIAAVAIGIVLLFKGIPTARKAIIQKIFSKFPAIAASRNKRYAVYVGGVILDGLATGKVGGKVVSTIMELIGRVTVVKDPDPEYKNDANAKNSTYLMSLMIIDESLKEVKQMRSSVSSGNFGE